MMFLDEKPRGPPLATVATKGGTAWRGAVRGGMRARSNFARGVQVATFTEVLATLSLGSIPVRFRLIPVS